MQTIRLAGGAEMPSVGLGMWKIAPEVIGELLPAAVEAGYRHFDNACDYGNEATVGESLSQILNHQLCRREDLWITSKLWNTYHAPEHVRPAVEKTLSDLKLDYLDLYLIHFPISQKYVPIETRYPPGWIYDPAAQPPRMEFAPVAIHETWQAMEELVTAGLVKNIGISNFGISLIRDLLAHAKIRPAVLQVELHPYLTQETLLRYCQQEGIAVTAFSPLGAVSYLSLKMAEPSESVLNEPILKVFAQRHNKTPAQILLRWGLQRGTAIVPKTSQLQRLKENLDLFDFSLTEEELNSLSSLNRNRRFNDPGDFCEQAFNTFCPIYE